MDVIVKERELSRIGSGKAFWDWVTSLDATDDPRGDFIQDSIDLVNTGKTPEELSLRIGSSQACNEAKEEYNLIIKEYVNELLKLEDCEDDL